MVGVETAGIERERQSDRERVVREAHSRRYVMRTIWAVCGQGEQRKPMGPKGSPDVLFEGNGSVFRQSTS